MERWKLEIFYKENPEGYFPRVIPLGEDEGAAIAVRLFNKFSLDASATSKEFSVEIIEEHFYNTLPVLLTPEFLDQAENRTVEAVLNILGFNYSKTLYFADIRNEGFKEVDLMEAVDFSKVFDYIVVQPNSDILLIHPECHWIILIDHEGYIRGKGAA